MEKSNTSAKPHRNFGREAISVNAEQLEEATATHGRSQKAIARDLGLAVSTLQLKLSNSVALREAYERGLERAGVRPTARRRKPVIDGEEILQPVERQVEEEKLTLPVRSSLIGCAPDDDLVLDAIRHGRRIVSEILSFTELSNARLRRSLDVLEFTMQVKTRYERGMLQHFYLATEVMPKL